MASVPTENYCSFDAGDMDVKQINKRLGQIAARRDRTAIKPRT